MAGQIQFNPGLLFDKLDHDDTATVVVNYTMRDSQNAPASSTLTLTVNGANYAPVANPDTGSAGENDVEHLEAQRAQRNEDEDGEEGRHLEIESRGLAVLNVETPDEGH